LSIDDQTRVKLKGLSHDYINANYVNVRPDALLFACEIYYLQSFQRCLKCYHSVLWCYVLYETDKTAQNITKMWRTWYSYRWIVWL